MAQSVSLQVIGAVTATPSTVAAYSCTLQQLLPLSLSAVYESSKANIISVDSTDLAPFSIPFENIIKGRLFGMRLLSGATMKLLVTTALGVFTIPVSDLQLIHNPTDGDEFTAIKLVGTGDVAYCLAGDVL